MAYYPQAYDPFFERVDDRGRIFREDAREVERHVKRQRQLAIAEELSHLATEEYSEDILSHMESMERDTLPDVASIDIQTEIQWFMRPYLLDFLLEAHAAFRLLPETLFLTINLIDRYCSRRTVYKRHYQLVGCAALLIAAKYGDRKEHVPTIRELKTMCCALYDDDMFTQMEWHVLQTLNWVIGHPTIDNFLQMALNESHFDLEVEHMACYISEIAMFHRDFVSKRSSDMARASLALARCILNRPQPRYSEWSSQYEPQTLVALSQHLNGPSLVLSRKYETLQLSQVSITVKHFLVQQELKAKAYAPPTPPCETSMANSVKATVPGGPYVTPTKQQYVPTMPNGCLTPPITPVSESFNGHIPVPIGQRCSLTPLSLNVQHYTQRPPPQYTLPSII